MHPWKYRVELFLLSSQSEKSTWEAKQESKWAHFYSYCDRAMFTVTIHDDEQLNEWKENPFSQYFKIV